MHFLNRDCAAYEQGYENESRSFDSPKVMAERAREKVPPEFLRLLAFYIGSLIV
jgi:hypothetical protein